MIDNFLFIFWLIGALVSTYMTFKYADIVDVILFNYYNKNISGIFFVIFSIISYTVLSWIGAIATYLIFRIDHEK